MWEIRKHKKKASKEEKEAKFVKRKTFITPPLEAAKAHVRDELYVTAPTMQMLLGALDEYGLDSTKKSVDLVTFIGEKSHEYLAAADALQEAGRPAALVRRYKEAWWMMQVLAGWARKRSRVVTQIIEITDGICATHLIDNWYEDPEWVG